MDGKGEPVKPTLNKAPAPKVKVFQCPQCAQQLSVRGMLQTTTLVCPSCGTVIDISDENVRIIGAFLSKVKFAPAIPLGTRGKLDDGLFELIGFMRRAVQVEGVEYQWSEYLLFNPYKGFRWLSEYNGHWNYIKTSLHRPRTLMDGNVNYKGTTFRHFQSANAKVVYVVGEFYWRVETGETCWVHDYVAPPYILSAETTDKEITWSLGKYIEPDEIVQAFQLERPLPARIGVGANQPSPHRDQMAQILRLAVAFLAIAFMIQLTSLALSQNQLVYQNSFSYRTGFGEKSLVTNIFELTGRPSNVVVQSTAKINNNWLYLGMALVNDDNGTAYDFGREIDYYFGTDSDGAWTEGSRSDQAVLPSVPAGHYYLRIEPEGSASTGYSIRVYRDVPRWTPFLMTLAALLVVPGFAFLRSHTFEYKRWSESDYPMTTPSFKGDDDE